MNLSTTLGIWELGLKLYMIWMAFDPGKDLSFSLRKPLASALFKLDLNQGGWKE